jgi:ATP-dependent DNA ligase
LPKAAALGPEAVRAPEHDDGAIVFAHACRMGLEGIVSKRADAPQDVAQVEEPGERGGAAGA